MIKAFAFDVFGTVFDLQNVDRAEIAAYVNHVRRDAWEPLQLPDSWKNIPAHFEAELSLERLRSHFTVVTCSNGPISLLIELSKRAGITWDAMIPLEVAQVYKPHLPAYELIRQVLKVDYHEIAMVTANRTFGDLKAAAALGMRPVLIRDPEHAEFADIMQLTDHFISEKCHQ